MWGGQGEAVSSVISIWLGVQLKLLERVEGVCGCSHQVRLEESENPVYASREEQKRLNRETLENPTRPARWAELDKIWTWTSGCA